jgi:selenocysteine-specific elongation factor
LAADLCRADFVQSGTVIRRRTHRPALPPHLQSAGTRLRAALAAKPFDPPSRKELVPDKPSEQALRFLVETQEVTQLSDEIVVLRESFDRMTQIVRDHLRAHGKATAGELRQAIGGSRRVVIPLLERLDRAGVTRREGDVRMLSGHKPGEMASGHWGSHRDGLGYSGRLLHGVTGVLAGRIGRTPASAG